MDDVLLSLLKNIVFLSSVFFLKTRMQNTTKLKKIIQDSKELVMESDIRSRMQALKDQLVEAINHVHKVTEVHVFVAICRGFWDRMGQV
jgi:hypothetical protein